ncbi:MAG: sugar kinase [Tabrizicola sp.]|nr:sugar kinase [Tabrizicola sp.]
MIHRVLCIGECMVEFAPRPDGSYVQGFAGDTFNMAWYLRRCLPPDWVIDYFTALGDDPMSERMLAFMTDAGIGTGHIARLAGLAPGLYVISLQGGERSFSYWRGQSAARQLAGDSNKLAQAFTGIGLMVLSGITLAILPEKDRHTLLAALAIARKAGSRIAFDPNIRPRLWESPSVMCDWIGRAAAIADMVLPSFEDEARHFGDITSEATVARYIAAGAGLVVVKNGAGTIHWQSGSNKGTTTPHPVPETIDTTAAGDSFNAGFLAAHLTGQPLPEAIAQGACLAAKVIQARGALVRV